MQKTILITGATDGIGLATAKKLVSMGHHVLLHGRNAEKLEPLIKDLSQRPNTGTVEGYLCDLSRLSDVKKLTKDITQKNVKLDVLINNAGVFRTPHSETQESETQDGLDIRFAVNTIAPYLLTKQLLPLMNASSRVINLSSAAQSSVNLEALTGQIKLSDFEAYSQSKLALTMWSHNMARSFQNTSSENLSSQNPSSKNPSTKNNDEQNQGPIIIAVNPGSMLGTKMVQEGFGVSGGDIHIGADILTRAALSDEFAAASGKYFNNDSGRFTSPHPDALNPKKNKQVVNTIEAILAKILN